MYFCTHDSPIGSLILAARKDGALTHLQFAHRFRPRENWRRNAILFDEARRQLDEYFAGKRQRFKISLAPQGTVFQTRVWQALLAIPHGTTLTYGDMAHRLGNPRAARAVGAACGANPVAIIIPCHRVVAANGLGGYAGGLEIKRKLLALEGLSASI